jgi:hypothetical protein
MSFYAMRPNDGPTSCRLCINELPTSIRKTVIIKRLFTISSLVGIARGQQTLLPT